jgi:hypothetical protein
MTEMPAVVEAKLARFAALRDEFEQCFAFVQNIHGQQRLPTFSIKQIVYYLHALWICDCKDRLLGVPHTLMRYEGVRCLELLAAWQAGDTASVVAFLHEKLDVQPFAAITHQLHQALQRTDQVDLARRLTEGRIVLLHRGMNLLQAFDAIFTLAEPALLMAVRLACAQYQHTPEQIQRQLTEWALPVFQPLRHPALARQNMLIMNVMGVNVSSTSADAPGQRTDAVAAPPLTPHAPYAEFAISGYLALTSTSANNLSGRDFLDLPASGS